MAQQLQWHKLSHKVLMTGACETGSRVCALILQLQMLEQKVAFVFGWRQIGRQLLNLACRHHISEIVLEKVFSVHDVSKSPNMELFSHFKDFWPRVDQGSFCTAVEDENLADMITPWKDDVIMFALGQLEKFQPRDDYCELLELAIIFLGGTPQRGIRFRYPGAIHRARWMARAIYSIKMWLFRKQYEPL